MRARLIRNTFGALLVTALTTAAVPAFAEVLTYAADLDGKSEVPPTDVKETGKVEATYDTASMKLTWTVTYAGLSGPATAAHFHGPAKPGANAAPAITLSAPLASPIKGEAKLTPEQANDLKSGLWYLNIHTAKHASGEIRGQLMKK